MAEGRTTSRKKKNGARVPLTEDRYACENVEQTQRRFHLPAAMMPRLRELAHQDPETDPWIGDYTRPEEFHAWLWGTRRKLEKKHPDLAVTKSKRS